MNDLAVTNLTLEGTGDNMTEGQNVQHERGTKKMKDGRLWWDKIGFRTESIYAMMTQLGCSKQG